MKTHKYKLLDLLIFNKDQNKLCGVIISIGETWQAGVTSLSYKVLLEGVLGKSLYVNEVDIIQVYSNPTSTAPKEKFSDEFGGWVMNDFE